MKNVEPELCNRKVGFIVCYEDFNVMYFMYYGQLKCSIVPKRYIHPTLHAVV
jgi:hypothetical protein